MKSLRVGDTMELDHLAYAGCAQFARQWVLPNRLVEWEPGRHVLTMTVGGSVGHGGLWCVDVKEGALNDDFTGRTWDVTVATLNEAKETAKAEAEERKKNAKAKAAGREQLQRMSSDRNDETTVLNAIRRIARGERKVKDRTATMKEIRAETGKRHNHVEDVLTRLCTQGRVEEVGSKRPKGVTGYQSVTAYRERREAKAEVQTSN